jgi:hypothetical protein
MGSWVHEFKGSYPITDLSLLFPGGGWEASAPPARVPALRSPIVST